MHCLETAKFLVDNSYCLFHVFPLNGLVNFKFNFNVNIYKFSTDIFNPSKKLS